MCGGYGWRRIRRAPILRRRIRGRSRLEGTLGRAESLAAVPVDLRAEWNAVPLGAASWVVMGGDMGVRGDLNLRARREGDDRHASFDE